MSNGSYCLLCFLDDDYQAQLRAEAQHAQPRHERALKAYKHLFVEALSRVESTRQCLLHNQSDDQFAWWVDQLLDQIRKIELDDVFDPLIASYVSWIRGELESSAQTLNAFLRQFGYESRGARRLDVAVYFRGRTTKCDRKEILHIPFDKRYCISNQRYSLSGQPLLYLGLSIIDVVSELRGDPLKIHNLSFSYFWLREPKSMRILDIGNALQDLLWNNLRPIIAAGSQIRQTVVDNLTPTFSPNYHPYAEAFITFVTAAICSFKRVAFTKDDKFAPEYVLPQLLAHWARKNKYDGILYTSTRIDGTRWRMSGHLKLNRYRENIALFTTFHEASDDEHDMELLQKFEISNPLQLVSVKHVRPSDMENLRREIIALHNDKPRANIIHTAGIDLDTSFEGLEYIDPSGRHIPYADTDCGRVQRYLQYLFMIERKMNW